jgi:hypothetical protein
MTTLKMGARVTLFNAGFMSYLIFLKNATSVNLLVENKRNIEMQLALKYKSA